MRLQTPTHKRRYLRRIAGAVFLFVLLLGISLPASSAASKASSSPVTVILGHPARVSSSSQATFVFYSNYWDVDSYRCALDRNAYKTCVPMKTYYGLKNGKHHFAVKAVSNESAGPVVAFSWTIKKTVAAHKTLAPTVVITSHPNLTTTSTSAAFGFASGEPKATYACVVDNQDSTSDGGYAPCASPAAYTGLAPGTHVFTVVAVANHLSSSPKAFVWTVSPVAPHNTALPAVSGGIRAGQTLTASSGSWTGSAPLSYSYQWQLCSGGTLAIGQLREIKNPVAPVGPVFCGDVVGATSPSYTIRGVGILVGFSLRSFSARTIQFGGYGVSYTLRVLVTTSNAAGQAGAVSIETSPILPAAPDIYDTTRSLPQVGDTLDWEDGFYGSPYTWTIQWQRCDASGSNCTDIPDATDYSYVIQPEDAGATLRVTDTATLDGVSTAPATSDPTEVIVEPI